MYSSTPFERPPLETCEEWSSKEVVSDMGEIITGIYTFVTSKANKGVVLLVRVRSLEGGVLLYMFHALFMLL